MGARSRITAKVELQTEVPVIELQEQRRIANFLDDQVVRIANIADARRLQAKLLGLAFDSNWDEIVASLRPLIPLRRFLLSITDGPFGSALTSTHYADCGVRVVRLGNIGIAKFRDSDKAYITSGHAAELSQHAVAEGDLLMAGLGDDRWPLGRCVVAPPDLGPAIVKADCYRIRLDSTLSTGFAAWYLSSPTSRSRFNELARGSTRARLNTQLARQALVPVVPTQVQDSIVQSLMAGRASLDGQLERIRTSLNLLSDLKRAMITAAVTGEFDVSSADGSRVPT